MSSMIALTRQTLPPIVILVFAAVGCESKQSETSQKPDKPVAKQQSDSQEKSYELPESKIKVAKQTDSSENKITGSQTKKFPTIDDPGPAAANPPNQEKPLVAVDEELFIANGIEKISSDHLTIYTDIRNSAAIKEFPEIFEQAINFWCQYFSIDKAKTADWKITAFIIENKNAFAKVGVLTSTLPKFATGYQHGNQIWIYMQRGNYYTRHLLLHEGTHAFMQKFIGGYGPAWYAEGMAEMLAVHRWQEKKLVMNYRLRDKSESEYWGRVRILRDDFKHQRAITLGEVLRIDPKSYFQASRPYAWSWAACKFFSNHPISRDSFKKTFEHTTKNRLAFNQQLVSHFKTSYKQLESDWRVYISEMDYGVDVAAAATVDVEAKPDSLEKNKFVVEIDSQRAWHRTNIDIDPDARYVISADGRIQIKSENGKPWMSEANGITIQYHHGRPLGQLLVSVDTNLLDARSATDKPLSFRQSGKLCLRINDNPAQLDDNLGKLKVTILVQPQK